MTNFTVNETERSIEEAHNNSLRVIADALNRHEEKLNGLGLVAFLTGASIIITVLSQNYVDARITRLTKRIAELEKKGE